MIALIEIALFVIITSFIDKEHLDDNDYIESHRSRNILRTIFILSCNAHLLMDLDYKNFIFNIVGMALFFLATFDNSLNFWRKKPMLHLGNTAPWDKYFINKPFTYITIIGVSLMVSIVLLAHTID